MENNGNLSVKEKYTVLNALIKKFGERFGSTNVFIPSECVGPIDISISSVLLMLENEKRKMDCDARPYGE